MLNINQEYYRNFLTTNNIKEIYNMNNKRKKTIVELTTLKSYKDILMKVDSYYKTYGRTIV